MKLIVHFFLLTLTVTLHQSASATDTCSVTSDGTVNTLSGAIRQVQLSSAKVRIFEVVDKENPTCDLLVKTRKDSNGEISWVAVSLIGESNGRHKRAYQFDLLSQNVTMRGQGFKRPTAIKSYPHTWTVTGITVKEVMGGWILNHNACGYEITVAEMEDRVLDIKIPRSDLLPHSLGPCTLSDCDLVFNGFTSGLGFDLPADALFELIGHCDGKNLYKTFHPDMGVVYLYMLNKFNVWMKSSQLLMKPKWSQLLMKPESLIIT